MKASNRLALNTLAQYIRTAANVIMSLFSTRLILEALGSSDFGLYTLIAGIVSMLSYFTNALTSTTQRYLSYNANCNDNSILKSYFFSSVAVHIFLGLSLIAIMTLLEPLLFNGFLNIQEDRTSVAVIIYFMLIGMLFISLLTSPYRAVLLTHENIVYISCIDVLDGALKLLLGFALFLFDSNRLIWYASLMVGISLFNFGAFSIYSYYRYDECKSFRISLVSKGKIKELSSFAFWTVYGSLCLFGRAQGIAIVLNKFYNTIANAAYGVALQINAAIGSISGALQTALSPQIIKAEGEGNREKMLSMSEMGCKISFLLISFLAFPIIFDINGLLGIWLKDVPENTNLFAIMLVVANLFDQLTVSLSITINAIGKIKNYTFVINTLKFLTVFVFALLLIFDFPLTIALVSYVVIEFIGSLLRLYFCHKQAGLEINSYIRNVILKLVIPVLLVMALYWIGSYKEFSILYFILKFIVVSIIYVIMIYFFSLNIREKAFVKNLMPKFQNK